MHKNEPIMKITKSVEIRKKILNFFSINHGYVQVRKMYAFDLDKAAFVVCLTYSISKTMIGYIESFINWLEHLPKSISSWLV